MLKISFKIGFAAFLMSLGFYLLQGLNPIELWSDKWHLVFDDTEGEVMELEHLYGIDIKYDMADEAIPELWKIPPANGRAKAITPLNLCRYIPILSRELKKYPINIIRKNLSTIYLLKELSFFGIPYGGSSIGKDIFLTGGERNEGYDDLYYTQLFHHEISSIFFRAYHFPKKSWSSINPPGFSYHTSDRQILKAISDNDNLIKNEKFYEEGFLAKYGYSTMENDFNLYAEFAFAEPDKLIALAERYPRVHQKVNLMKKFYSEISKDFSLPL